MIYHWFYCIYIYVKYLMCINTYQVRRFSDCQEVMDLKLHISMQFRFLLCYWFLVPDQLPRLKTYPQLLRNWPQLRSMWLLIPWMLNTYSQFPIFQKTSRMRTNPSWKPRIMSLFKWMVLEDCIGWIKPLEALNGPDWILPILQAIILELSTSA